ncbi:hypothetical protein GQ55_6G224800 [Panicum hallii var. hallii]|uniref:Uncharacterized protein n=1 Tax=Panicum hallii var. hallii TaxID=1504633 RepID=A0A2T7D8I4_9POAL|nr:hypothetical protein GQ55_6G224800 [Panicum hallii var. hallii]
MGVFVFSRPASAGNHTRSMLPVRREKAARRGSRAVSSSHGGVGSTVTTDADPGTAAVELSAIGEWRPRRSSFRATEAGC